MFQSETFLLILLGFCAVPGGLLLTVSSRLRRQPLSDHTAHRLLYGLLITTAVLMFVMYALERQRLLLLMGDGLYIFGAPLLAALVAITCLHLARTPMLWNARTALILGIDLIVIGLINSWYVQNAQPYPTSLFIMLTIVGGGLTIAFVWLAAQGHGWWLWLALAALIAAVCIENFVYNGVLATWPGWLLPMLGTASTFLIPVVLVTLAGRAAAYLADPVHPIRWRSAAVGAVAVVVLLVLLLIHIVELTLVDGTGDDGTLFPPLIFELSVMAVALLLIWSLQRRRIVTALAFATLMTAAVSSYLTLTYSFSVSPEAATTARAEQIDQAIHQYYADSGQYPADLTSLVPHYLLAIPNPVLDWDQQWCYQGGSDFYRLGYIYRPANKTVEYTTTWVQGQAGEPPAGSWACDDQLAELQERWGIKLLALS